MHANVEFKSDFTIQRLGSVSLTTCSLLKISSFVTMQDIQIVRASDFYSSCSLSMLDASDSARGVACAKTISVCGAHLQLGRATLRNAYATTGPGRKCGAKRRVHLSRKLGSFFIFRLFSLVFLCSVLS
jgi:hypothetical protein